MKLRDRANKPSKRLILLIEIVAFVAVLVVFTLKIGSYLHINVFSPSDWSAKISAGYSDVSYKISESKFIGKCPSGQLKVDVGWEYVCREPVASNRYVRIYDTAPRDPNGNEVVYLALNRTGTNKETDSDNLDTLVPLINAAYQSRDPARIESLVTALDSFTSTGINAPHAWDDPYVVAWRSMVLTDAWWKLRSVDGLPVSTSSALLSALERHGAYLAQSSHYDSRYGHGTDEAAALLQLGGALPFIENAAEYRTLGLTRTYDNLMSATDTDGALKAYSPSYQFEALAKYWDIGHFIDRNNLAHKSDIDARVAKMITYATYILQPNGDTPVINSSAARTIRDQAEFADIADASPAFKYTLTGGKDGSKPPQTSVAFDAAGQTVMRSSWKQTDYAGQTQALFNYNPYASGYSLPDSLALNVYAAGQPMIVSPGIPSNITDPLRAYFTGTASQNTVTVDGQNQRKGTSRASGLITKAGYTMQSAANTLSAGVSQQRQVIMLSPRVMVVIDNLSATDGNSHTYAQKFNFAPNMDTVMTASGVTATAKGSDRRVEIKQLGSDPIKIADVYNQRDPANAGGICVSGDVTVACHQLVSTGSGKAFRFVTLIKIGTVDNLSASYSAPSLSVGLGTKSYTIKTGVTTDTPLDAKATDPVSPTPSVAVVDPFSDISGWTSDNGTVGTSTDRLNNAATISLTGSSAVMTKPVAMDLSSHNLLISMKVLHPSRVQTVDITLESGTGTARLNMMNAYKSTSTSDPIDTPANFVAADTSGWLTVSLAKGEHRNQQGQWQISGDFSWQTVSRVNLSIASNDGSVQTVLFSQLGVTPEQTKPSVSLIFDDGSSSILPAVDYMNERNLQGTVAVIGKYSSLPAKGFLTVAQLHQMKDHGWSLVNHSFYHVDGPATYSNKGDLQGFQTDLLMGAQFLEQNGLDTDPNWYIYPHGTTSTALQNIVAKYYKFARTEQTAPETYPFGSPHAVKDFVVYDTITPENVIAAIEDAIKYNQTLILTFHRIHTNPTDKSGYDFGQFTQIIDYLADNHIPTESFNQLDQRNGTSSNSLSIVPAQPAQLSSMITVSSSGSWWDRLMNAVSDIIK